MDWKIIKRISQSLSKLGWWQRRRRALTLPLQPVFVNTKSAAVKQSPPSLPPALADYLLLHLGFSTWSKLLTAGGDKEKSARRTQASLTKKKQQKTQKAPLARTSSKRTDSSVSSSSHVHASQVLAASTSSRSRRLLPRAASGEQEKQLKRA